MAATAEGFEHIVWDYVNPVTNTRVKLIPPAECMSQEEYDDLLGKFALFCEESWKDKKDPDIIDPRQFRAWGEDE